MRRLALVIAMLVGVGVSSALAGVPRNTALPTISGTPQEGSTLTADPGTWTEPPTTFAYSWLRCDQSGSSCSAIIGAHDKTHVASSADVANTLRVRVRATNQDGSNTATSAPTAVIKSKGSTDLSLDSDLSTIVYGQTVTLSGTVSSGQAGEKVTIVERRAPFGRTSQSREVASVVTTAGGDFGINVKPVVNTRYTATIGNVRSESVRIDVRPLVRLNRLGTSHRFLVRVNAVRSFVGKYALLQKWNRGSHVWSSIKRVYLTRAIATNSPTIVSRAIFRHNASNVRLRMFLSAGQAAPGYLPGISNSRSI
jgi:hypothetical protein